MSHGESHAPIGGFQRKATGDEAKNYDFVAARPPAKTTNLLEATGHLIKSCLGGGVVAIHESFKECGLLTAAVLTIVLGIFVCHCMYMLVKSAQKIYGRVQVPAMSFPDLAEASLEIGPWPKLRRCGKVFRYLVDATICIDLFGACVVYVVVAARSIKQLCEGVDTISDSGNPPIRIYILALLVPFVLLSLITSLKYLAPFSIVADVFIFIIACATVYYGCVAAPKSPVDMPHFKSVPGLLEFLGVCVFSMEGIGATLVVENSMTSPKKFPIVLVIGMGWVISMVWIIGFFGYWGFGEGSKSPITVNFPLQIFPIILKVFLALMVYITFALNFWVPFNLIWVYLQRRHNPDKYWLWERVYRVIFVSVIVVIAVIFPNVSKFIGLIGAFCLSNMGFIYPAVIELSLDWEDPGLGFMKWRLFKASFIILFGMLLCIVGTYSNLKELIVEVFITKTKQTDPE